MFKAKIACLSALMSSCLVLASGAAFSSSFSAGPFIAKYYVEDDGTSPGSGSDGSDPSIVSPIVAKEITSLPSIQYSWDGFHDIDSYNFMGTWEGEIHAYEDNTLVFANFDVSWSHVRFFIDGELVSAWNNQNRKIPLSLEKGSYHVRVEHHNHWHTVGFNLSFTDYPSTTKQGLADVLDVNNLISEQTKVVHVVGYESDGLNNEVLVSIPEHDGNVVIFASSYNAMNWVIDNPHYTKISAVVINSYAPGAQVLNAQNSPVVKVTDFSRDYGHLQSGINDIREMIGVEPDFSFGQYGLSDIEVPEFAKKK